jgi:hypothetical protein
MGRYNLTDARSRAQINSRLPCEVPRCCRRRKWTCRRCSYHQTMRRRYGSEGGRAVHLYEWEPYRREVRRLFEVHHDHPALLEADRIMASLIERGPEKRKKLVGRGAAEFHRWCELTRLRRAEVTPRAALEAVVSLWCYALEQNRLNDGTMLAFALAGAVYKLAPYRHYSYWDDATGKRRKTNTHPPASGALQLLGQGLLDHLGVFVSQVFDSLKEVKQIENDNKAALLKKMDATAVVKPLAQ